MPNTIETILAERGKRYGKFTDHAEITQRLKDVMRSTPGNDDRGNLKWDMLNEDQKEALEMIAHKIGRILNGDPNYHDNWADIAGYATLVADRLVGLPERCVDGCASKANPEPWCDNLGGHL